MPRNTKKNTSLLAITCLVGALAACGRPDSPYTGELNDGPQKRLAAIGEKTLEAGETVQSALETTGEFVQSNGERVGEVLETTGRITTAVVSAGASRVESLGAAVIEVTAPTPRSPETPPN